MTTATESKTIKFAVVAALAIGSPFEGGSFAGIVTLPNGSHVAIALLPDKPEKRLEWAEAKTWAESVDGQLPSRPVAALLYANVKPQLESAWHWTADELRADTGDEDDASYAWICSFDNGGQVFNRKDGGYAVVAVRLIHLEV